MSKNALIPCAFFLVYVAVLVPSIVMYRSVAILAAFGIVLSAAIMWNPFVGVLASTFLGMIGELQHFGGSVSVAKITVLLTLLSYAAHAAAGRQLRLARSGFEAPLLLFVVSYIFGIFVNLLRGNETLNGFTDIFTLLGYPVAFVLFLNLANTERRIKYVLLTLMAGGVFSGLASVLQQFFSFNLLTSTRGIEQITASNGLAGMTRNNGLMLDPNAAAYPHLLALPVIILMLISAREKWPKLGMSCAAGVSLLALAITFSRSGYIAFAGGLLPLFFFLRIRKLSRFVVVSLALFTALLFFVPLPMLIGRFGQIEAEQGGESDRSIYFKTAALEVVEHPLIPAGEADFMAKIEHEVGIPVGPHANVQAVMINSGLLGLVAFLWLGFKYIVVVSRGIKKMPDCPLKYYALGGFLGVVGFHIQGFFITNMAWYLMWAIAAIPVSCILVYTARSSKKYVVVPKGEVALAH